MQTENQQFYCSSCRINYLHYRYYFAITITFAATITITVADTIPILISVSIPRKL